MLLTRNLMSDFHGPFFIFKEFCFLFHSNCNLGIVFQTLYRKKFLYPHKDQNIDFFIFYFLNFFWFLNLSQPRDFNSFSSDINEFDIP